MGHRKSNPHENKPVNARKDENKCCFVYILVFRCCCLASWLCCLANSFSLIALLAGATLLLPCGPAFLLLLLCPLLSSLSAFILSSLCCLFLPLITSLALLSWPLFPNSKSMDSQLSLNNNNVVA